MRRKYPIGIQSFEKLRNDGYLYVDKSFFVKELSDWGCHYFLSRPRRFGKSLFVDTLHCAFEGKKHLFEGLYLEDKWDWDKKHPVLKVSFGSGVHHSVEELQQTIEEVLNGWQKKYNIQLTAPSIKGKFKELIEGVVEQSGEQAVVLIDEYDKPILDNITNIPLATDIREELKNFCSVLKDSDQYLKMVFITGVSKFSKVSLFSGLNHLEDLTINPTFSSICGYTQEELESNFTEELKLYDKEEVRTWYNGYSWGNSTVYNPFGILQFFKNGVYKNYWFESGTPSFLLKLLTKNSYSITDIEDIEVSEAIAESFELEDLELETLLFQTGYLTIRDVRMYGNKRTYILSYPNLEVKMSLNDTLLEYSSSRLSTKEKNVINLYNLLEKNDLESMQTLFHSFFASVPSDWFRKNNIAEYEGFYASVFYAYFAALGLNVRTEDPRNDGRMDMTLLFEGRCYIFEFKVVEYSTGDGSALQQIKDKKYADKYSADYKEIYLVGVEFRKEDKNIVRFEYEQV